MPVGGHRKGFSVTFRPGDKGPKKLGPEGRSRFLLWPGIGGWGESVILGRDMPNRGMEGDDCGHAKIDGGLSMPGGGEGPFLGLDKCLYI